MHQNTPRGSLTVEREGDMFRKIRKSLLCARVPADSDMTQI